VCVAAGLILAGCKGSRSDAEPPSTATSTVAIPAPGSTAPAAADTSAADTRPLLVCFGDSLTAGYGTNLGEDYPNDLQQLLDERGYKYRVLNAGISGDTTKDGLERIGRVIARHPQIVVVEFGGNDGLRGLPVEQAETNLSDIIHQLQSSGAQVALAGITLPPDYGKDYIAEFDAIYPALAKKYHIRLLPFILKDVYGVPGDMQDDATHATAKGNKQVALNVEALVQPLLKR